jgi:hypothetical protein
MTHNGRNKDKCFNPTTIIIVCVPSDHASLLSTPGKKGRPGSPPRINMSLSP